VSRRDPRSAGTWKDLTDNVNLMAGPPGKQYCRSRHSDLTATCPKNTVDVKARLELKNTVNTMVDQLNRLPRSSTGGARSGFGRGVQAEVRGAGTWKDLTDNVNSMAGNLTASAEHRRSHKVAANGDLSKKITVDVSEILI